MKNRIVAACAASLLMAACNQSQTERPVAAAPRVIVSPRATPLPPSPAIASLIADAGALVQPEAQVAEVDPLPLPHDHRGKANHLVRAEQLKSEGDSSGALAEARRAVFDSPVDEEALSLVARLARQTGQKEIAAAAYGRLGELRPEDAVPLIAQARVLVAMKDLEGAVMVGADAIVRDGHNPEAFQVVGLAYLAAGELQNAVGMFEKVIALSPEHGWAHNNLGFALLRSNRNERAVEVLARAAELLPHVAYVQNNLGVAYERTGDMELAKAAYARSTSLSPRYVKAKVNSARVARAQVATEEAAAAPEEPVGPELDLVD